MSSVTKEARAYFTFCELTKEGQIVDFFFKDHFEQKLKAKIGDDIFATVINSSYCLVMHQVLAWALHFCRLPAEWDSQFTNEGGGGPKEVNAVFTKVT